VWEYLIAFVLLAAAANGWWGLGRGRRGALVTSAKLASLGWIMVTLLFVGGFLTIAGEWFRMWANKQVDASSAALQNFLIAAVGLILVHLPERREPADQYYACARAKESDRHCARGVVERRRCQFVERSVARSGLAIGRAPMHSLRIQSGCKRE